MSRRVWAWLRLLAGAAILVVVVARLGTGPFLHGLRTISGQSLAAAAALTLLTTVCSAWRWRLVARGLGVGLPLVPAAAAYYRSQFLNTVLPGGILGDVHRAVSHGRDVGDVGRGLRAVAWERSAGQVLQVVATLVVLLTLPSPVRRFVPVAIAVLAVGVLAAALALRALPRKGPSRVARAWRAARADVREGLLGRQAWPGVTLASVVIIAGHTATFLVAARTAGVTAPIVRMLPLVLLVMLAMAVPTNIGGWGPREGAAAWLFGLAGLGAAQGVAAATVYGVLVVAATLPGALVLLAGWARQRRPLQPAPGVVEGVAVGGTGSEPSRGLTPSSPGAGGVACG
jgi:glycosyltransferase 2 family protein